MQSSLSSSSAETPISLIKTGHQVLKEKKDLTEANKAFNKAAALYLKDKNDLCLETLTEIIMLNHKPFSKKPTDDILNAAFQMASALKKITVSEEKDPTEKIKLYEKVMGGNKEKLILPADSQTEITQLYYANDDFDNAKKHAEKYTRYTAHKNINLLILGLCFLKEGNITQARKYLCICDGSTENAIEKNKFFAVLQKAQSISEEQKNILKILSTEGFNFLVIGKPTDASDCFKKAILIAPYPEFFIGLSLAHLKNNPEDHKGYNDIINSAGALVTPERKKETIPYSWILEKLQLLLNIPVAYHF